MKALTKLICTLLAATTALLSFAACGNSTDYSDIGFQNIHDMDTWIQISHSDYSNYIDFSDFGNAYFGIVGNDMGTLKFSTGSLLLQEWDCYSGSNLESDDSIAAPCVIADNYNLSITSGEYSGLTVSITEVQMVNGIPFIQLDGLDGWYIPTGFIDWSRSPEKATETATRKNGTTYERDVVRYYINSSYLKNE